MLQEEPDKVIDDGDEDAIGEHFESELGDSVSVEHHVQSCGAYSQVEVVWPHEHDQAGDACVEPEQVPGETEPGH